MADPLIDAARKKYHNALINSSLLCMVSGCASNADKDSQLSRSLGEKLCEILNAPCDDDSINNKTNIISQELARNTPLRKLNSLHSILHASISAKWAIRSDRAQNSRTEALNLIRNRKGPLPHIMVVTGEPLPSRIESLALGTGDIDCVYHFALPELLMAAEAIGNGDRATQSLRMMIEGNRLRDISDMPFDLSI